MSAVEVGGWGRSEAQKDAQLVPSLRPTMKPASASVASQRKISDDDDDDDASDSEKMVICEDETAGMIHGLLHLKETVPSCNRSVFHYVS